MYEALVMLCLSAAAPQQTCRDVLIPGYSADTPDECVKDLADRPPAWLADWPGWSATCAPQTPSALAFDDIGQGVFVHFGAIAEADAHNRGDVANIAFVIGTASVAVIDSGGSRQVGEDVYRAVRERTALPISHLILTHAHPDHIFGMPVFADAGAQIVGHHALARALADREHSYTSSFAGLIGAQAFIGSRVIAPGLAVEDTLQIDLGGRLLELRAWPTAHSTADLTVFDGATATLFAGDLLFDRYTPALDGSLTGWQAAMAGMLAIPARRVVPGHGGPVLPWPGGMEPQMRYLSVLAADTRSAIASGLTMSDAVEVIGRSEAGNWLLFDLFNPRNATTAFSEFEWE